MAAPTFVASTHADGTGTASITINKPAVLIGDVMLARILGDTDAPTTGWTDLGFVTDGFGNAFSVQARIVDGTEGSSFNFTCATHAYEGSISSYRGVDPKIIDVPTQFSGATSGTSVVAPSITTVDDNCLIVCCFQASGTAATGYTSGPAGFSVDVATFGTKVQRVDNEVLSTHGASGTATAVLNASGGWFSATIALLPTIPFGSLQPRPVQAIL